MSQKNVKKLRLTWLDPSTNSLFSFRRSFLWKTNFSVVQKENEVLKNFRKNVKRQRPIVVRGQMAFHASHHFETFKARNSDSWAMARFVLAGSFSLFMGRKRSTQGLCRFKVSRNTQNPNRTETEIYRFFKNRTDPKSILLTAINRKPNLTLVRLD